MANLFKSDFSILRLNIAANVNNVWETIAPHVEEAQQYILDIIGQDLWDKLQNDVDADSTDADHLALLALVRRAQANFAYLLYASDGTILISDSGFLQIEDSGTKSAYQWQVREFKKAREDRGWEALHRVLKLLMAKRDVYTEWSNNDIMSEILACWLPTLEAFNLQRKLSGFQTLWALRPSMLFIQDRVIKGNISTELYEEIEQQFLDDDLSADNKILFKSYIAPVIAHTSLERALTELNFQVTSKGLKVEGVDAVSDNSYKENSPGIRESFNVREDAHEKGQAAIKDLRNFLDKNASSTKYSGYFNDSELFSSSTDSETYTNDASSGSYFAR